MVAIFLLTCIAGSVAQGSMDVVATQLTANITTVTDPIPVASTEGFPETGVIVIGDEHIAYSNTSSFAFNGNPAQPLLRGTESTDAVAHLAGAIVRTKSGALLNTAADYDIAVFADASGAQAFLAKPVAFFQLIGSFFFLPIKFLGTDLQFLGMLWTVVGIGMIVALVVALAGGRRI